MGDATRETGSGGSPAEGRQFWLLGSLLVALVAPLPWLGNLRDAVVPYLALGAAATLALYLGLYLFGRSGAAPRRRTIIVVAMLLRLAVLPMLPSLSDDAYRYLWDGRLLLEGVNPYFPVPADPSLARFHDELFRLQGYPTTTTIYPPAAQIVFALSMALAEPFGSGYMAGYLLYKLLLIGGELAAIWLLVRMLDGLGISRRMALLYAWHPLVVVELSGQGHTDAFWVLGLALGLYGYMAGWSGGGMPGLALGAALRLHPLVLLPLWGRYLGARRWLPGLALSLPFLFLFIPLLLPDALGKYLAVLERFTNYYEFNGGFYYGVKWLLDELHLKPSNRIAGGMGAALQLLCFLLAWFLPVRGRSVRGLAWRALIVITAQIVFGAKVHIWYFAAPLFLLPLAGNDTLRRPWMWAALAAPFTYLMYTVSPPAELMTVVALEWGGFLLFLAYQWIAARKGRERRVVSS